ncbi:MAG: hypothetical protein NTU99_15560 [Pseudanabaena sp. LacPavin_0818_WC45_MAG_42_6]|jgi:hypothetical protein|nr:hypothetical protein [Pseudanabaena sp. LacPavin_0818_WC45_MAG_42_6]
MSLVLGQIKTQELFGGTPRRQTILGFYVVVNLATAIYHYFLQPKIRGV